MKHSLIVLFFLLFLAVHATAAQGGYSVDSHPLQNGTTDYSGAENTISFFELPLWIQITWSICFLIAIFGAIKFSPLVFGKVKTILQNKNRTLFLEYIGAHPGCIIADLSKNTGINRGTARYHLYLLLLERKVVQKKYGKLSYIFANSGRPLEKKRVYGYIMNPTKQKILNLILDQPGISNKEIAERLDLKRNTIHWHLQQFIEEEMVAFRWDGRNRNYIILPEVEAILRKFRK